MFDGRSLTFRAILGPEGFETDRTIEIGPDGRIVRIVPGGPPYDGFIAIPGMTNAHSHVFQRALAGRGEEAYGEESFWTWRKAMYRLANAITPEQLYAIACYTYAEMMCNGFTHVVEFHYLHHQPDGGRSSAMTDAVVTAANDIGLPLTLLPVYYRTSGFDGAPASFEQKRFAHDSVEDFLLTLEAMGDVANGVAPHSLRAVPPEDLVPLVEGAEAILGESVPIHIHVSEQMREVLECRERFGRTPIELLGDMVPIGPRWNLVHATHATDAERVVIREAAANVVLCPLTEAYLGDGIFQAHEHFHATGFAAIGSDCNVRVSPIDEVRQLEYGQRLRDRKRARLATEQGVGVPVWSWLVDGGRRAAGYGTAGLSCGSRADLIALDEEGPTIRGQELEIALDAWLVGGDVRDIASVYVAGQRRVENGVLNSELDTKTAFAAAMRAIWSS